MTTEELQKKIELLLQDNEEWQKYRQNRRRDCDRRYLPDYHFNSPGGYMNDPCGYCCYRGIWHLFYQFVPEYGELGWGHAVSVDKIHWLDLPAAIMPTTEICCGSGGTCVEENRVIACYQGDWAERPGGAIHIMESCDDLLVDWRRVSPGPVITTLDDDGKKNPYNAFDPCMWKVGDTYYLLSAGGGSLPHPYRIEDLDYRKFYLFTSTDLVNWEYQHPLMDQDRFSYFGDDGACPYFLPIGNEGKYLLLHFSHMSGSHYLIGSFDTERLKFSAEDGGAFNAHSWLSGGVHAPSACADGRGGINAIFNLNYGINNGPENQIMSLPQLLTLGEHNRLLVNPDGDYESLRCHPVHEFGRLIPANQEVVLTEVVGKALEIRLIADTPLRRESASLNAAANLIPGLELRVLRSPDCREYTSIRFYRNRSWMNWYQYVAQAPHWANASESVVEIDLSASTLSPDVPIHPAESQRVFLEPDQPIDLHIFVDKSVVEVFANGQKCIAVRTYPSLEESTGVSIIARGTPVEISYDAWRMNRIHSL